MKPFICCELFSLIEVLWHHFTSTQSGINVGLNDSDICDQFLWLCSFMLMCPSSFNRISFPAASCNCSHCNTLWILTLHFAACVGGMDRSAPSMYCVDSACATLRDSIKPYIFPYSCSPLQHFGSLPKGIRCLKWLASGGNRRELWEGLRSRLPN